MLSNNILSALMRGIGMRRCSTAVIAPSSAFQLRKGGCKRLGLGGFN